MAKGLPYFKFTPTEWLTGNICFEPFELQGLFINICALYWQRDGKLSIDDINLRYNKPTALLSLTDRYFSVLNGFICIEFLNEQLHERKHISVVNSTNGSKGGRPKTKETKPTAKRNESETKAKKSQEEKEKEKELNIVDAAFNDFLEMRIKIKKPPTDRAIELLKIKLDKLAPNNDDLKLAIINQSIIKSWQDFFELQKPFNNSTQPTPQDFNSPEAKEARRRAFQDNI